ncbi:MAG: acyl-CoA dehydratase activase [Polyangia bacterium]|jgi:predicted CoA-substrate-specific enzyme activase|nr:acyl-CoA dehydratase activase [Polyangia bacterium]
MIEESRRAVTPGAGPVVAIGVDVGSTTWKAVAVDAEGRVAGRALAPAHPLIEAQTARELAALRERVGAAEAVPVGATGYGRKRVGAQRVLTEITCHARGAYAHAKRAGVLVDLGGQDSKVIHLAEGGGVDDFAMNDKCAAGTGRFLEVLLGRLGVTWDEVAAQVASARELVAVSSTCTVFAESEVISLLAEGKPVPGILKGVHQSLASRVSALAGTLRPGLPVFMSGGVALNPAMVSALSETLGRPVEVLPEPQYTGALGAALSVLP